MPARPRALTWLLQRLRFGMSPGVEARIQRLADEVSVMRGQVDSLASWAPLAAGNIRSRRRELEALAAQLPAEPVFGLDGITTVDATSHDAHVEAIALALTPLHGRRLLVVECGLGYLAHALAARGAHVTAWDSRPEAVDATRFAGELIGSPVAAQLRTPPSATTPLEPDRVDAIVWLDSTGIVAPRDAAGRAALLDFAPHVFVVDDGALVHLERERTVTVGASTYAYSRTSSESYPGSVAADLRAVRRRYYWGESVFIKRYTFGADDPVNRSHLVNEFAILESLKNRPTAHLFPRIVHAQLDAHEGALVFDLLDGPTVCDLAEPLDAESARRLAHDVLEVLIALRAEGLWHNDVRSWNVLQGRDRYHLIDYGLSDHRSHDDDRISLLWTLHAARTGLQEAPIQGRTALPPVGMFSGALGDLYVAIDHGEQDLEVLRHLVSRPRAQRAAERRAARQAEPAAV